MRISALSCVFQKPISLEDGSNRWVIEEERWEKAIREVGRLEQWLLEKDWYRSCYREENEKLLGDLVSVVNTAHAFTA